MIRTHRPKSGGCKSAGGGGMSWIAVILLTAASVLLLSGVLSAAESGKTQDAATKPMSRPATMPASRPATMPASRPSTAAASQPAVAEASLEQTRLVMGKWIETQQIISKERNEWQQGKEILLGRLELVKKEIATIEEKNRQAQSAVSEANQKRDALLAENDTLKAVDSQLVQTVTEMEGEVKRLYMQLPDPVKTKIQPLYQRIPEDPAKARVAIAERYQNVLGILNEVNKANNEINVVYEVHNLSNGKPAEVQTIYVGIAQAYYVSAAGEAGISQPTPDGWKWQPAQAIARDLTTVLEILQGKQTPAFVPVPVKIQ